MDLINGLIIIIGLLFAGDIVSTAFDLPIPGSVIGMLALLIILITRKSIPKSIGMTSDNLVKYIGLLFVPAGAGVSLYLDLIVQQWPVIILASFTSTILTFLVCSMTFKGIRQTDEQKPEEQNQ